MFFKKKENSKQLEIDQFLNEIKISVLTLDKKWYNLFQNNIKSNELKILENKVNNLLKERGRLTNEYKSKNKLKKTLMDEILNLTTEVYDKNNVSALENMEKNKERIEGLNIELELIEKRLCAIPDEIEYSNKELFIESVLLCYKRMKEDKDKIEQLEKWISDTREELKNKIIEKEECEKELEKIYSLIHNIAGADIIDNIDRMYGE